jgi:hypothetical protein
MGRQQQIRVASARRMVAATVLGIGLAAAAASCTSSGTTTASGPAATSATATTTTEAHSGTTPSSEATTTTADETTTTPSSSTSDPNELTPASIVVHAVPGQEGYCGSIATAMQDMSAVALMSLGGGDTGYADKALKDVKDLYRQLAQDAPDDIRADVQTLSDKLDAITDASQLQRLDDDQAALAAGERFTSWIKTNCGFDPNNPSG